MDFDTRDPKAVADLRDAQENGNVIGLAAVTGYVVPRQDIDDFLSENPAGFNLFLLALQALQASAQKEKPMSYYQISGIHGLPKKPWNKVNFTQEKAGAKPPAGYCAHSMDKFPTWHRPYLALLEQTIYSKMIELVQGWVPEVHRADQLKAANNFRLPYWDYWKPRGGPVTFPGVRNKKQTSHDYDFRMPDIFVAIKVMVRKPDVAELVPIDNPLAFFEFPEKEPAEVWPPPWKPITSRYPGVNKPVTAMDYHLNMMREGSSTQFNNMVQDPAYKYYADFGKNAFGGGDRGRGSLENMHNNYHVHIGGGSSGGHMTETSVAAFDPVFWVHHCQIDRLLAIWQQTHPDSWFDGKDDLVPFTFRNGSGKKEYWTSDEVRKPDVFGYTYPDIDRGQTPYGIKKRHDEKYGWTTEKRLEIEKPPEGIQPVPVFEKAQVFRYDEPTLALLIAESKVTGALDKVLNKSPAKDVAQITASQPIFTQKTVLSRFVGSEKPIVEDRVLPEFAPSDLIVTNADDFKKEEVERTWYVDNIVERLVLNGAFTIFFFIGAPDVDDPAMYSVQPTLAGITHNFAAPTEYCDNCGRQEEQGHSVSGTVVITPILKDYILAGKLRDLTPESVKPFLVKFLKWRIVTVDGQRYDPRFIPGLALGITSKVDGPEAGRIRYQEHNDIIKEILQSAT